MCFVTIKYGYDEYNYGVCCLKDINELCKVHDACDKMYLVLNKNTRVKETDGPDGKMIHYTDVERHSNFSNTGTKLDKNMHVYYGRICAM
jgi:hypothetical protein